MRRLHWLKISTKSPEHDSCAPQAQVYGIASEDMDSLTFATPRLIRNLMKPQTQNVPINEYDYDKVPPPPMLWKLPNSATLSTLSAVVLLGRVQVIEELALTPDQFVDLCILCGCDYCGTIKGVYMMC